MQDKFSLIHILIAGSVSIAAAQRTDYLLIWLDHEIFTTSTVISTLCSKRGNSLVICRKLTLPKHCVAVGGGERICNVLLTAQAIATVLRLAVDNIARNAER